MQLPILPPAWASALAQVRATAPSAVIVGGALRDLVFGGEVKDLDIFVPHSEVDTATLNEGLSPLGWISRGCLVTAAYQTGMRGEVRAVEEYSAPGLELEVQIIHLEDEAIPFDWSGEEALPTFREQCLTRVDFDACQVTHDGHRWDHTPAFLDAYRNRKFTLIRAEDEAQMRRSWRRAQRFAAKYPGLLVDLSIGEHLMTPDMTAAQFAA